MTTEESTTTNQATAENVRRLRGYWRWSRSTLAEHVNRFLPRSSARWTEFTVMDVEGARTGRARSLDPSELVAIARAFRVTVPLILLPDRDALIDVGSEQLARDTFGQMVLGYQPEDMPPTSDVLDHDAATYAAIGEIASLLEKTAAQIDTPDDADVQTLSEQILSQALRQHPRLAERLTQDPPSRNSVRALARLHAQRLAELKPDEENK